MASMMLMLCVLVLAGSVSATKDKKQCLNCVSMCLESSDNAIKAAVDMVNKELCNKGCADPSKADKAVETKHCANDPCYSVMASLKLEVEIAGGGRHQLVQRIHRRDCVAKCPKPGVVCDLLNIDDCGFDKEVTDEIKKQVSNGEKEITQILGEKIKGVVTVLSKGGEMLCCTDDKCNKDTEPSISNLHLKDEL